MPKRYKYAVYGSVHPAPRFPVELLGRYRARWTAKLKAWWWPFWTGMSDSHAWVREEHVTVFVQDGKAV